MIGYTLSRYFGRRYLRSVLAVLATLFVLIYILDFVESMRRFSDAPNGSVGAIALLSLLRTPSVIEQTFPFVILLGSMICFVELSRRLELVVARAAGLSVWQFLVPPVVVALGFGIVATVAFNPLSASMMERSETLQARIAGNSRPTSSSRIVWLRQNATESPTIIRARALERSSNTLEDVTFYIFDNNQRFARRIEAPTATLEDHSWHLTDASEFIPDNPVRKHAAMTIPSSLTAAQLEQRVAPDADSVSFWRLPAAIAQTEAAGPGASRYRLQYQTLLARPMLLLAMVLIAATVSLRFARFGGTGRLVLGGLGSGFVLYVVTKITNDVGSAGLVNAAVAAWTPAVVGVLIGVTVLLNQEDG